MCAEHTGNTYDDNYHVIGTGSCFGNTLRCFAVSSDHQGEGLLNEIISHLIDYQYNRGNLHLFLYTKIQSAKFFRDLGFYEITHVDNTLVFMENRRNGFSEYLKKLQSETAKQVPAYEKQLRNSGLKIGALVMNANPFTLGHQYLVEKASSECDFLHVFVVSEDARLDLTIFSRISQALGITARYVGEEPTSQVTGIYNRIMSSGMPETSSITKRLGTESSFPDLHILSCLFFPVCARRKLNRI